MDRQVFCQKILLLAKELGCTNAQYFYGSQRLQRIETAYGELSNQVNSFTQSLSLRVEYQGKIGAASTEIFTEPEIFVERAIANASVYEKEEPAFFLSRQEYTEIEKPQDPISTWSLQEKIDFSFAVEKYAKSLDSRVQKISHTYLSSGLYFHETGNTNGMLVSNSSASSSLSFELIAEENGEMLPGNGFVLGQDIEKWQEKVKKTVLETASALGAKSLVSGKYPAVFSPETFMNLFSVFAPAFSAKNVLEGKSFLAKSLQKPVAASCFTLIDQPFNPYFPVKADDEGVPVGETAVISGGVLQTFLHNSETAHQMNTQTTGNASYSGGQMFVSAHSWHIMPQENTGDEAALCAKMPGTGVFVQSLAGLHAGANPVTGDFSLLATGYLYENGKALRPVNQFTIAGNFFELLKLIQEVGSERVYGFGSGLMATPAILVQELAIAGAEHE